MARQDLADERVRSTIDREVEVVLSAIRLVASGATARTTVVGLRLPERALELARPEAARSGVELLPLYRADEEGLDIEVRRSDPGTSIDD